MTSYREQYDSRKRDLIATEPPDSHKTTEQLVTYGFQWDACDSFFSQFNTCPQCDRLFRSTFRSTRCYYCAAEAFTADNLDREEQEATHGNSEEAE